MVLPKAGETLPKCFTWEGLRFDTDPSTPSFLLETKQVIHIMGTCSINNWVAVVDGNQLLILKTLKFQ